MGIRDQFIEVIEGTEPADAILASRFPGANHEVLDLAASLPARCATLRTAARAAIGSSVAQAIGDAAAPAQAPAPQLTPRLAYSQGIEAGSAFDRFCGAPQAKRCRGRQQPTAAGSAFRVGCGRKLDR